jgi:hypothetical protein
MLSLHGNAFQSTYRFVQQSCAVKERVIFSGLVRIKWLAGESGYVLYVKGYYLSNGSDLQAVYSVLHVVTVKLLIYLGYYNGLPCFTNTFFAIWH